MIAAASPDRTQNWCIHLSDFRVNGRRQFNMHLIVRRILMTRTSAVTVALYFTAVQIIPL
jgi:hypothetical protein